MSNLLKINISFAFNEVYLIPFIIVLIIFTFYIYRITIPRISNLQKIFFISLRILALFLIILAIFEPVVTLSYKKITKPFSYIFIDNSKSISFKDSVKRSSSIKKLAKKISNQLGSSAIIYNFGKGIKHEPKREIDSLKFNEPLTNFSSIFDTLENTDRNIASAVIISDGILTSGYSPVENAEKDNVKIFTVGVGDSTIYRDIKISKIFYNKILYSQKPTTIIVTILNKGFANRNVIVTLMKRGKFIQSKNISLNADGVNSVDFSYTPQKPGGKYLTASVTQTPGEVTFANNRKTIFVKVLNSKIKILIVAGAPSADLSFVKNSLLQDSDIELKTLTQINRNKYLETRNPQKLLTGTKILVMIGYPAANSSKRLMSDILSLIKNKYVPYLFIPSHTVSYKNLKKFGEVLGFTFNVNSINPIDVQPKAVELNNPLLKNNAANYIGVWNNLPPVFVDNNFKAKPGSKILVKAKIGNIVTNRPLILTRNIGQSRSIAILAEDIWKWKLQTTNNYSNLFDQFFSTAVKWLNTNNNRKLVQIRTSKKVFSQGENVTFFAEVYNQVSNPVDNASVTININNKKNRFKIELNSKGNGLYEGEFQTNLTGKFSFFGIAKNSAGTLGKNKGEFLIKNVNVENIDTKMDKNFLQLLSDLSGGRYYDIGNTNGLIEQLKKIETSNKAVVIKKAEIVLWSNKWLLIIIILLLSFEWFFRKRAGML